MIALLAIPVLVAGFVACHIHPYYYYKLHRYEGQYLYLKSAELGLKCLLIALALAWVFYSAIPDNWTLLRTTLDIRLSHRIAEAMVVMGAVEGPEATRAAWAFQLSILTFASAWVIKYFAAAVLCLKYGVWKKQDAWRIRAGVMGSLLQDSPLDRLLFRASIQGDLVLLCLEDRSAFVGQILSLGEPNETDGMDQDVAILPVLSGYRDKDTLRVHLKPVPSELLKVGRYMVIRQPNIVVATDFDLKVYAELQRQKQEGLVVASPVELHERAPSP